MNLRMKGFEFAIAILLIAGFAFAANYTTTTVITITPSNDVNFVLDGNTYSLTAGNATSIPITLTLPENCPSIQNDYNTIVKDCRQLQQNLQDINSLIKNNQDQNVTCNDINLLSTTVQSLYTIIHDDNRQLTPESLRSELGYSEQRNLGDLNGMILTYFMSPQSPTFKMLECDSNLTNCGNSLFMKQNQLQACWTDLNEVTFQTSSLNDTLDFMGIVNLALILLFVAIIIWEIKGNLSRGQRKIPIIHDARTPEADKK